MVFHHNNRKVARPVAIIHNNDIQVLLSKQANGNIDSLVDMKMVPLLF